MQKNSKLFSDGFASLERGMDSGRSPSLLARNQFSLGINTTIRGGFITHRPGFRKIALQFLDVAGDDDATLESRATSGRWQGAGYYCPPSNKAGLAYSVSGRQFLITLDAPEGDANIVHELTPGEEHSDVNNPYRDQVWMVQAEDFLIIQDNESKPIIYNGASARRSNIPDKEVPVGSVMAYGLGRLWVARGRNFVASDIVLGPSGTTRYSRRDAVLKFTENDYLNEGGSFRAPGNITAMDFPANLDTALGEGELHIFTRGGATSMLVPPDRDTWKNLNIPLFRVVLRPRGATSQNSVVNVNGDTFFRAEDGIRSFMMAQRQFGQWGNTPSSQEMLRILQPDDRRLLAHASAVLFDNRVLMTTSAVRHPTYGVFHRGLVALNFDSVSGMADKLPPAYDGVWTGLNILQIITGEFDGVERCFIFALSDADEIELWELTRDDYLDRHSRTESTRIVWEYETGTAGFEDAAEGLKKLASARIFADELRGQVDFSVKFRPDQYPLWLDWSESWTKRAAHEVCEIEDCEPAIPLPQHRTHMGLPEPAKTDETTNNQPLNLGHEFQFRVRVEGSARIRRLRVRAQLMEEPLDARCPASDESELLLAGCPDQIFTYQLTTPAVAASELTTITDDDGGAILDDDMQRILGD